MRKYDKVTTIRKTGRFCFAAGSTRLYNERIMTIFMKLRA
jgi:hypothetical protein